MDLKQKKYENFLKFTSSCFTPNLVDHKNEKFNKSKILQISRKTLIAIVRIILQKIHNNIMEYLTKFSTKTS